MSANHIRSQSTPVSSGALLEGGSSTLSRAVPRQGHVLSTVAEQYGSPVRVAVRIFESAIKHGPVAAHWRRLYGCRRADLGESTDRSPAELAGWVVVAAWILGVSTRSIPSNATLLEGESWFLGGQGRQGLASLASREARADVEHTLRGIADAAALADLLPYILDPHGQGSRLSVRRRPETVVARERKRAEGVFYTPGDVAAYMAAEALRGLGDDAFPLTVFDPACGTGVFLRAVLAELQQRTPQADAFDLACSCLYGTDIDGWAIDASAFVLLHACFAAVRSRGIPPVAAWHALRLNLAQFDVLRLDPGAALPHDDAKRIARLEYRARLKAGEIPEISGNALPLGALPFHSLFPELAEGPRIIIGNPPYADVGVRADFLSLTRRFETLSAAPRPTADLYPLFVEQMVRLTAPDAHGGAIVLPLSLACNTGPQFVALRGLLARTPGDWRFAFFDREPHALFGEDVKTRNAIALWTRHGNAPYVLVSTGPLRKWRGHSRARMFESISFTPITVDIRPGIPKVEGEPQATALAQLLQERRVLRHAVRLISRATLEEAFRSDGATVYVGPTAYNFLNVFLRPSLRDPLADSKLTEHPLHALVCATHGDARRVFAVLSSRFAFWWWHVNGDGFHVSRRVIEDMPVGEALFNARYAHPLAELGEGLWRSVVRDPIVSLNRGRTSLGFSALPYRDLRAKIDALLVDALGLRSEFVEHLERFTSGVTTAHVADEELHSNQRIQSS